MELHRNITENLDAYKVDADSDFSSYYAKAKKFVLDHYSGVYEKYLRLDFNNVHPEDMFNEVIWVIHASGFSAKAVGKFIPKILPAYGSYTECALSDTDDLVKRVSDICNNPPKIRAVQQGARIILEGTKSGNWELWYQSKYRRPEDFCTFPYIGNVTCYHIARNLGMLHSVKPDLHLNRLADHYGFTSAEEMCKAAEDDVPLGLVDLALWYHSSTFGTLQFKKSS